MPMICKACCDLADEFRLNPSSLRRHARDHVPKVLRQGASLARENEAAALEAVAVERAAEPADLLARVRKLFEAKQAGDPRVALLALDRLLKATALEGMSLQQPAERGEGEPKTPGHFGRVVARHTATLLHTPRLRLSTADAEAKLTRAAASPGPPPRVVGRHPLGSGGPPPTGDTRNPNRRSAFPRIRTGVGYVFAATALRWTWATWSASGGGTSRRALPTSWRGSDKA